MKNIVISGSGISGLLYALLMVESGYAGSIHLVDKALEPGGLLRRYRYGDFGDFDYGMHNLLETGIAEIDELIFGLMPREQWDILEGANRDLCGIYYLNALQHHTPYIDIRNLPEADYRECLAGFLEHLSQPPQPPDHRVSAHTHLVRRFGRQTAERVIVPAIEKIHKHPAADLDYMATIFTPLSRITVGNEFISAQLTASPHLRETIAWSEQRTLPLERSSGRRAYYPSQYGMYRLIDAICARLRSAGVNLILGAEITSVSASDNRITGVKIQRQTETLSIEGVDAFAWTAASPVLARLLGVDTRDLGYDKPLRTAVVNLLLAGPLKPMGDLHYFFCYEPGFHTYRLTNFANYCSGAVRGGLYPVSLELLVEDAFVGQGADLAAIAQAELERFGLLQDGNRVVFAKTELLDSGFPMPTSKNVQAIRTVRDRIARLEIGNLDLIGILARDNLFFQTDVMRDVHQKVQARCQPLI